MQLLWKLIIIVVVCVVVASSLEDHRSMRRSRHRNDDRSNTYIHHIADRYRRWRLRHDFLLPSIGRDWGYIGYPTIVSWIRGPNVCEQVINTTDDGPSPSKNRREDGIFRHSYIWTTKCDDTGTAYKCTITKYNQGQIKKTTTIYHCCHGYQREEGQAGCPTALELLSLTSTLQRMNLSEMEKAIRAADLEELLNNGNHTLFVPSNNAMLSYTPRVNPRENTIIITPDMTSIADGLSGVVAGHVVNGFVRSSFFDDNLILDTENPATRLRINLFDSPKKMVTVNCVPVTSTDHLSTNGVIHTTSQVVLPVEYNLLQTIRRIPQLSMLQNVITRLAMEEKFRSSGHLTLFAPTDQAFNKLNSAIRDDIYSSNRCLKNILLHHIMSEIICSSVIEEVVKVRNLLNQQVNLSRTNSGEHLLFDKSEVIQADIMTTNGVIHLIDEISVPLSARNILSVIEQTGATHALRLFEASGLTETLKSLDNFTIFLPSNEAFQMMSPELKEELGKSTARLTEVLKYHIVPRETKCGDLIENSALPTLHDDKQIMFQIYVYHGWLFQRVKKPKLTAQCAPISKMNIGSCSGGVVHVVDKVLVPPEKGVMDILYQNQNFSKFLALLREAGYVEKLQQDRIVTVLTPTNQAFDYLSETEANQLKENAAVRNSVIERHIIPKFVCCSAADGIRKYDWPRGYYTLEGLTTIHFRREDDRVTANGQQVSLCDQTAMNGVVHGVDRFLVTIDDHYSFSSHCIRCLSV